MGNNRQRILIFGTIVAVAVLFTSFPQLFYDDGIVRSRFVLHALLIIGFLGSILRSKPLRFVGWIGIFLFIPIVVIGSMPNLDHPAFDANGQQRPELWIWKWVLAWALSVSLVVSFRKLRVLPGESKMDSADSAR